MFGLSVKLWQEGSEEDFCLLLPGLSSSVTFVLNALLEALAVELEPKDFALLSSQIPSDLLSPSNLPSPPQNPAKSVVLELAKFTKMDNIKLDIDKRMPPSHLKWSS